jgi:hypothetical protein
MLSTSYYAFGPLESSMPDTDKKSAKTGRDAPTDTEAGESNYGEKMRSKKKKKAEQPKPERKKRQRH